MPIGPGQPAAGGFTQDGINSNAPNNSGVYAIYNSGTWIYIGESGDIQERLLDHARETGTCIKRNNPTNFAYELALANQRVARQNELIRQLEPVCNQRLG